MKKLMLGLCFMFGGFAIYAQEVTPSDQTQPQQQYPTTQNQDDRERINSRDLPDAVKRSLETQEYRGWLINTAYKTNGLATMNNQSQANDSTAVVQGDTTSVTDESGAYGQEIFVVEMKNGAQTKTVRFDKDGNRLDDAASDSEQK
jgi:hypothetical protein